MKVTALLADSAQAVENKLYILGGGWSVTGPVVPPMAIAFKIDVPWDQANRRHKLEFKLMTTDGELAKVREPDGNESSIEVSSEFEAGRPPGLAAGTPIEVVSAINFGPIPLTPGQRYEWRILINGEFRQEWGLPFSVRVP